MKSVERFRRGCFDVFNMAHVVEVKSHSSGGSFFFLTLACMQMAVHLACVAILIRSSVD